MPYIRETCTAGRVVEVYEYHTRKYPGKGERRAPKTKPTPEDVAAVNARRAETELRRLLNANFGCGDLHIALTYRKGERPPLEQAERHLKQFIRRLRAEYRKTKITLKYIVVTEWRNKAIHHHLVITYHDVRRLQSLWPHGHIHPTPLDDSGQYAQLASYLIKETGHKGNLPKGAKRWRASRNLDKPVVKKRVMSSTTWGKEPKIPKGYTLEKDSERTGWTVLGNWPYRFYSMRRII